jgi:hypothetical protein
MVALRLAAERTCVSPPPRNTEVIDLVGDRSDVVFLYKSKTSDRITALQRTEEMGLFPIGMACALFKVGDEASVL